MSNKKKILILGAGFGGLELSSRLSEALADQVEITLIDQNEGFIFGFSKFDLMLGHSTRPEVTYFYKDISKPSVEFRQETVVSIDPVNRRVTTDKQDYETDVLVVALGAEYSIDATPGFVEGGHEFYSFNGAIALHNVLEQFESGKIVIGIIGQPFKCPPAPCEAAILLDEWFEQRGLGADVDISVVSQWPVPIPPSPDGTKAILDKFDNRGLKFVTEHVITSLDPERKVAICEDGEEIPYDLFLGIPIHRVPAVVDEAGLAEDDWIPVDDKNLETKFSGVFAVGDVTSAPTPKSGVFAESAARAVADHLIAEITGEGEPEPFDGKGSCYVEFGDELVGRMDADFFPGTRPTAPFAQPSVAVADEKKEFAAVRRKRWIDG
ncbi:MAG: FAD-dependent oxidoreductase [Chloroflexi bacterium]|jgi:sulfide:quinone oxidoreductase|nr:FAD-dependent oxidoreductase [Chloroflexota bacterium]MBT5628487.1 FAD-dependent oxidoreductase [Chloroflexota bacterium]